MRKILVIGKNGQLARELKNLASVDTHIECLGREEIDLLDQNTVNSVVKNGNYNAIINASAYTAVDKAEEDRIGASELNITAVENLAVAAKNNNCQLVHVSTDFVFDGTNNQPYKLDAQPNPINVYGETKLAGERKLTALIPNNSCIIRTSWVYSVYGNNFVKTMLRLMAERDTLSVVDNQMGSPTHASTLAKACLTAAKNKIHGIQHWTGLGVASWYDFAESIKEISLALGLLTKDIQIIPINDSQYPTPAARPKYSVLDKSMNALELNAIGANHWRAELRSMLLQYKEFKELENE